MTTATGSAGRVLLIDDSTTLLMIIGKAVAEAGHEIKIAKGGAEGLAVAGTWKPDVIVCDLMMPEMDGFAVIQKVKELDPRLPVVVLSGESELNSVLRAVHRGAFDYVLKAGKDIRPLLAAIDRALVHVRLSRENERLNAEVKRQLEEVNKQHGLVLAAQEVSERLLLNIFPQAIADRLKADDRSIADAHAEVTVLFADIVGFTEFSAARPPEAVVEVLNSLFSEFDRAAEAHGVEKIKTVGDAYMAAAGAPLPHPDHAESVSGMALAMLEAVRKRNEATGENIGIRIGINSGPVTAGVIGQRRFIYDLWGDTVNVASRMEAQGVAGEIQVTESTYAIVKDRFVFKEQGEVEVKGKGAMRTYLLREKK
jgi:class 3 adenylate cyclase